MVMFSIVPTTSYSKVISSSSTTEGYVWSFSRRITHDALPPLCIIHSSRDSHLLQATAVSCFIFKEETPNSSETLSHSVQPKYSLHRFLHWAHRSYRELCQGPLLTCHRARHLFWGKHLFCIELELIELSGHRTWLTWMRMNSLSVTLKVMINPSSPPLVRLSVAQMLANAHSQSHQNASFTGFINSCSCSHM